MPQGLSLIHGAKKGEFPNIPKRNDPGVSFAGVITILRDPLDGDQLQSEFSDKHLHILPVLQQPHHSADTTKTDLSPQAEIRKARQVSFY